MKDNKIKDKEKMQKRNKLMDEIYEKRKKKNEDKSDSRYAREV